MSAALLAALLGGGAFAAAPVVAAWDLDGDDGGFTTDEELGVWEWGPPTSGPGAAATGSNVWATVLDGNYVNDNQAALVLPAVDLLGAARPVLRFSHWLSLRPGDLARVELFVDGSWQVVEPIYGYPTATPAWVSTNGVWVECFVDLSEVADASAVRLNLVADGTGVSDGWYIDDVAIHDGDIVPPRIEDVDAPTQWSVMSQGPTIDATVRDDVGLASLAIVWSTATLNDRRTTMSALGSDQWTATLPALSPGALVEWRIEASDGVNVATWPDSGVSEIDVFLPAPTGLSAPDTRLWGLTVPLDWLPPETEEVVDHYLVHRNGELVAQVVQPQADAPAQGPVDSFTVRAVYNTALGTVEGDDSDPLEVEIAVPVLQQLSPDAAWQGDRVRVVLTGAQLLLDGGDDPQPQLDLGPGVVVEQVVVDHVDKATFTLAVDPDAEAGLRDAVLTTDGLDLVLADAFEVLDGADRPAITDVSPADLEQGAQTVIYLTTNTTFDDAPLVDLGEGIIVEDVSTLDGVVTVIVAVANDAPLGLRPVQLDDGTRILELDDGLRVRARTEQGGGCSSASAGTGTGSATWLLLSSLLLLRRRR